MLSRNVIKAHHNTDHVREVATVAHDLVALADLWELYLRRWTTWNHVRTAAAMVAALLCSLGLMKKGGA